MAGPDGADPFSRNRPLAQMSAFPHSLRLGVPRDGQLIFFGDKVSEKAYGDALKRWTSLGATLVEFDLEPFYETARLLYEGPWVAERYLVIRNLLASSPDAIHPVTREITAAGARLTAADTFAAFYRLQGLRKHRRARLRQYRRAGAADGADRVLHRAGAGQSGRTQQPARHLHQFCQSARSLRPRIARGDPLRRHSLRHHAVGAERTGRAACQHRPRLPCRHQTDARQPVRAAAAARGIAGRRRRRRDRHRGGRRASVGHGAQRRIEGAARRLLEATATAPDYKLYALDTTPPKPGMLRVGPERDRRSSSKSGRCRRRRSENSSPLFRRRSRSAPSASPTAAA